MHAGATLTRELEEGEAAFEKRFQQVFGNDDNKGKSQQGMLLGLHPHCLGSQPAYYLSSSSCTPAMQVKPAYVHKRVSSHTQGLQRQR